MELVLGCAQLGMPYGINNKTGKPSIEESFKILDYACKNGITTFDTARAYGDSESIIGDFLNSLDNPCDIKVQTKIAPNSDPYKSISESSINLGIRYYESIMFHRLSDWQNRGNFTSDNWSLTQNWGVSVLDDNEAIAALDDKNITFLQIPFNLLDWRFRTAAFKDAVRNRPNVHIQARSVFLQGLLFQSEELAAIALAYVKAQKWIKSLTLGVETLEQLKTILRLNNLEDLTESMVSDIELMFSVDNVPVSLVDPNLWGH